MEYTEKNDNSNEWNSIILAFISSVWTSVSIEDIRPYNPSFELSNFFIFIIAVPLVFIFIIHFLKNIHLNIIISTVVIFLICLFGMLPTTTFWYIIYIFVLFMFFFFFFMKVDFLYEIKN